MSMLKVCVCQVAARQFPVERHFAARTEEDYLAAAYNMVSLWSWWRPHIMTFVVEWA